MPKTILVTGATGTVGSQVLQELAVHGGLDLRAAVRDVAKASSLPSGANAVTFDFAKPETWAAALSGVNALFLVAPFSPEGVAEAQAFIRAAAEAGVRHIVKLSVIGSVRDLTIGRWHAAMDDALKASGIAWTILLPTSFMQNFVDGSMPRPDGVIYAPVGNGKVDFLDTRDIAAVAAKALTDPGHNGKEYTLTGPDALTHTEVAAIISQASGIDIRFVDIPEQATREGMLSAKLPEWLVNALLELSAWTKSGTAHQSTNTVAELLGHPPGTFRKFASDYAAAWKG